MLARHVCRGCGQDLARVRAWREPHEGWRLVTCPGCGTHRSCDRPASVQVWRELLRWGRALGWIGLHVACAGVTLGIFVPVVIQHPGDILNTLRNAVFDAEDVAIILLLIGGSSIAGAWATVGFPHWPRGLSWAAVIGLIFLAAAATRTIDVVSYGPPFGDDDALWFLDELRTEVPRSIGLMIPIAGATFLGLPLGIGCRCVARRSGRLLRGRYRRSIRRRRSGP